MAIRKFRDISRTSPSRARQLAAAAGLLMLAACQTAPPQPVLEGAWVPAKGGKASPAATNAAFSACLEQSRQAAAAGGSGVQVTGNMLNALPDYLADARQHYLIQVMHACMAGRGYVLALRPVTVAG